MIAVDGADLERVEEHQRAGGVFVADEEHTFVGVFTDREEALEVVVVAALLRLCGGW